MEISGYKLDQILDGQAKPRVMIVDSRELCGVGTKLALLQSGIQFEVDHVADVEAVKSMASFKKPALVIFSCSNSGRCVYGVADEIKSLHPEIKTAFLARGFSSLQLERGLRVKGLGFFLEQDSLQEIVGGIKRVLAGEKYISKGLEMFVGHLDHQKINHTTTRSEILALTNRQIEVLVYLAKGSSVKEVARVMHISDKSVDSHKYRIMHRLNIHDRVELALFALREGLVDL